jgi:serine/threonine-protein kinase
VTGELQNSAPVREGDVLAGKYRVEKVLGEGAMGVVVAAMHVHLGERVALKFLKPEHSGNPEIAARFLREAQSAVRIKGEHVARVSDVGTLETGAPYMVMEYLTGSDLGALLEKRGKLDVAQAVDCVIQACSALAEAHALGIVHRDLKPANLFLTTRADGSALVKVLDFGVAKLLNSDPSKPALTANGAVIGSPLYMSPEQLLGKKSIDARSDVWQLGVILYELITGVCPFDGRTMAEIMIAIGAHPPKPLRQLRPDAPPELEALIARSLEKDVANRLPDVAALAEGLLPFATTRRAHVAVEHIVTMLRGAAAAANLPPMRGSLPSGAFMEGRASSQQLAGLAQEGSNPHGQRISGLPREASNPQGQRISSMPREGSNPYAQTVASPQAEPPRLAPAEPNRMAQTQPATGASNAPPVAAWIFAAVSLLVLGALAFAFANRPHDPPQSKPAAATAPAK